MAESTVSRTWPRDAYCTQADLAAGHPPAPDRARDLYQKVCRFDLDQPGFCLIDLGPGATSESLRAEMIALARALGEVHRARAGRDLVILSASRFDQQVSTKLHRDGGPDESLLVLGYEPSAVRSSVAIADSSRCASDLGLTPDEFLARHNPMFGPGARLLEPYTTPVECFSNLRHQILILNNSLAIPSDGPPAWQGVLHAGTVENPSDTLRRVVNSLMLAPVPLGSPGPLSDDQIREFLTTTAVRRRGYDKGHLDDDA